MGFAEWTLGSRERGDSHGAVRTSDKQNSSKAVEKFAGGVFVASQLER